MKTCDIKIRKLNVAAYLDASIQKCIISDNVCSFKMFVFQFHID